MCKSKMSYTAPNILNLCIDDTRNGEGSGRIYHCYNKEPILFENEYQMIRHMERLFENISYPQASTKDRLFIERKDAALEEAVRVMDPNEITNKGGEKGTFIVHVQYRQNATWQGEVVWAEKKITKSFRSALELLKLIDSALEQTDTEEAEKRRKL